MTELLDPFAVVGGMIGYRAQCPECGFEYAHLAQVDVWCRQVEDGPSTRVTAYMNGIVVRGLEDGTSNPSSRRTAAVLWYNGECEHNWSVAFVQHKGAELVETKMRLMRSPSAEGAG